MENGLFIEFPFEKLPKFILNEVGTFLTKFSPNYSNGKNDKFSRKAVSKTNNLTIIA